MTGGPIEADDPVAADLLAGILQLFLESGGWLHPQARLRSRDGELTVHCAAGDDEPLALVPHATMVRVGRVEWAATADGLSFDHLPDEFEGIELEMLSLLTALLNQCQKIPSLVRTHPALAEGLGDGLIDAVRAFRPGFRRRPAHPAAVLWSTRCFRLSIGGTSPEPVAVPIIDLLDHHRGGAAVQAVDDAIGVPVKHPGGDAACFLDYGWQRDAIGTALVYGFADHSADIAHSAPVTVEAPGIGTVRVNARGRDAAGQLLPIRVDRADDEAIISHLGFGPRSHPVRELMEAAGWARPVAEAAVTAIAEANLALAEALASHAAAQPGHPAAMLLAEAASLQMGLVSTLT